MPEGELCLVAGRTGSGKSTLLGAINGLVPHFTGGRLAGRVTVDGLDTAHHPPRDLASVVGRRRPGPARRLRHRHRRGGAGLRHGAAGHRARGDAAAGRGDARPARHRRPARPRPAGAVRRPAAAGRHRLGAHGPPPGPRSRRAHVGPRPHGGRGGAGRDHPPGARPRHDGGHGRAPDGAGGAVRRPRRPRRRRCRRRRPARRRSWRTSPVAPPVVELGRLAGWSPLPLSVRDARREAGPLRELLSACGAADPRNGPATGSTAAHRS